MTLAHVLKLVDLVVQARNTYRRGDKYPAEIMDDRGQL